MKTAEIIPFPVRKPESYADTSRLNRSLERRLAIVDAARWPEGTRPVKLAQAEVERMFANVQWEE